MEKRTLLAVVLSVVVISGGYLVQGWLFPTTPAVTTTSPKQISETENLITDSPGTSIEKYSETQPMATPIVSSDQLEPFPVVEEKVVVSTDLVKVVLSNRGGDIVSFKLLEHKDGDDQVEMILSGDTEAHSFTIAFGGIDARPINDLFHVKRVSERVIEFYRDFSLLQPNTSQATNFRLTKRYEFKPGEYLFELSVTLDAGFGTGSIDFEGNAYTLGFGPQIGPKFVKLTQNYEYRRYYSYSAGKRKTEKVSAKAPTTISSQVSWAAIAGKYFTFIAIPDATNYTMSFSATPVTGITETSKLYIGRPPLKSSKATDTYRFYLGPKTSKALSIYNSTDKNSYKLRETNLSAVVDTSGILGPLETGMKWFLMIFYQVIPNYGIAIILLTILVKLVMFPLTKKGSESTIRMQALSPKIKEIQDKFKDNPNKMNVEMAELYKKEGYNPLSGCLPMLLQIPIFFAMYNLFNNHFDLRGAMFIPGWIPDLSIPESIWSFAPFQIPFLGWSNLRLLPFLYLGSQLMYGKVTQTPDQQNNSQMKMMLYMMPIVFFFVLYDVPAGLLLYWIMSNLLTMVQQLTINKYLAKKKMHNAHVTGPVIAPRRKK